MSRLISWIERLLLERTCTAWVKRQSNLLLSIEHGESEHQVVLCRLWVSARVFDNLYEFFELKALAAIREARDLSWASWLLLRWLLRTPSRRRLSVRHRSRRLIATAAVIGSCSLAVLVTSGCTPVFVLVAAIICRSSSLIIYEVHISCPGVTRVIASAAMTSSCSTHYAICHTKRLQVSIIAYHKKLASHCSVTTSHELLKDLVSKHYLLIACTIAIDY